MRGRADHLRVSCNTYLVGLDSITVGSESPPWKRGIFD